MSKEIEKCKKCRGSGNIRREKCHACAGSGKVELVRDDNGFVTSIKPVSR